MVFIPKSFPDCVVALGILSGEKKDFVWIASGFFYAEYVRSKDDATKLYSAYLVTNRHVLQDLSTIFIRCNPQANASARVFAIELLDEKQEPIWLRYPDPKIDVAIVPVNFETLRREGMQVSVFRSDEHTANVDRLNQIGVTEGDFVYVLGFPMGLVGGSRMSVIVRSGSIARIRDALAKTDTDFLIDAFVFPGNSGGPVVLKPEVASITGTVPLQNALLIGIVKAYVPYLDVAVSQQTNQPRVIFEENSGLAAAHPIDYVQDLVKKHMQGQTPFVGQPSVQPSKVENKDTPEELVVA